MYRLGNISKKCKLKLKIFRKSRCYKTLFICRFYEEFENDTVMINDKRKFLNILELSITGMDPAESWYNVSTASLFKELEGNTLVNWKEHGYSMILDILMV